VSQNEAWSAFDNRDESSKAPEDDEREALVRRINAALDPARPLTETSETRGELIPLLREARAALAADGPGKIRPAENRLREALRALADEHERVVGELSARDAEDVRRSEEGRTDWDYEQRIAALTVNPDAPIPYAGHGPEYVVNLTPPTDDEREALANLIPLGFTERDGVRDVYEAADRILAAGFRRQGPITDAQVEAAARAIQAFEGNPKYWRDFEQHARAALEAARDAREE